MVNFYLESICSEVIIVKSQFLIILQRFSSIFNRLILFEDIVFNSNEAPAGIYKYIMEVSKLVDIMAW